MGIFNSGVGKRSRRYAMAMMDNEGKRHDAVVDALTAGTNQAKSTLTSTYKAGRGYLSDAFKGSRATLQGGQTAAQDFLQAGLDGALGMNTQARNDLIAGRDAALGNQNAALGSTTAGYAEALQALRDRYGQAATQGQAAVDAFDPLLQRGMEGLDRYSALINGSLGAGTPEEQAAAVAAFQAGPGYQWQVNQASQAAQRAANLTGSASSGNSLDAVTRLASNLANQEYGNWQDRLVEQQTGYRGQAQTATAGRAAALTNLGALYQQQAGAESGLITDRTGALNSIYNNMSQINQTSGQNLADNSNVGGSIITNANTAMATNATNYAQLLSNLQTQYGQDRTNLRSTYGSSVAGLQIGLAGGKATAANNYWNGVNQALGVALQGSNQQGAETASWGQGLIGLSGNIAGMGVSGGGTVGGNFLSSLFK